MPINAWLGKWETLNKCIDLNLSLFHTYNKVMKELQYQVIYLFEDILLIISVFTYFA